jgi:hypothetical protein
VKGNLPLRSRIGARAWLRPGSWRPVLGAALVVLAALGSQARAVAPDAQPRPATSNDCQSLLHQFDVAWPAHREAVRAAAARHSRDLGEAHCNQGRYADGVHLLRRALHDIGVKPVKAVAAPPRR